MKNILINGLLIAVVSIVLFFIFNLINPSLNFDFTPSMLTGALIYLFFLIRAGFQQRKNLDGFLGFGEVFLSSIAIYALASLIATFFFYIMLKSNSELTEVVIESSKKTNESLFGLFGMSDEQIALEMEKGSENFDPEKITSFSNLILSWLGSIFFPGLVYVLIASLITKKKDTRI